MILLVVFSFLVLSTVLVYFISHRYNLHSSPFLLGNFVGYISCALLGNLIFSIIMQDSGAVFADYGSLLGGGLGWTAAVVGMIMMSHPPKERLTERPFATDNSAVVSHSTIQIFWMLAIWGFIAVLLAIIFATVLDFVVFLIYGFLGFEITDLPILIARIIYVLVCVVISYFISIYLFQKKAQLIYQTLYPDHTVSASYTEQEAFVPEDKPKKRVWLWWLGGCGLLACLAFGAMAFFLFNLSNETSYPLNGNVAFPSAVKKGGDFDFVITLSNSTTEPIFIKHVVLHSFLSAPSIFDGASLIGIEPDMDSEPLGSRDDLKFAYFQDIKPGETITFIFHLQAQNIGTYYENVGVYAKDPSKPDPAFIDAFHYATAAIEVTP